MHLKIIIAQRTLYDIRDRETYTIRKLADGNCWMTENLRLTLTEGQAIEISDGSMWLPKNYDGSTAGVTTITADTLSDEVWYTTATTTEAGVSVVRSYDTAGSGGKYLCASGSGPNNGTGGKQEHPTELCYETAQTLDGENQKIGVFYNWYTATAGQGTLARGSEPTTISICPKNWALPSMNDTPGSYDYLVHTYGFSNGRATREAFMTFPQSFITGGFYNPANGAPVYVSNPARSFYITNTPFKRSDETGYINYLSAGAYENQFRATNSTDAQRYRIGGSIRCTISGS